MNFHPKTVTYVIKKGDNLYQLSQHFKTSVQDIWLRNPGLDPYHLQVDSVLTICPGPAYSNTVTAAAVSNPESQEQLSKQMREAWEQHVFWTRLLLVSLAERLKDAQATEKQLLSNPAVIAGIFGEYYNQETQDAIQRLLTEHLKIGGALIVALRDGESAEAERLNAAWYKNADEMAGAFSSMSPHYNYEELKEMLYTHLDLTTKEVACRLKGDYTLEIAFFEKVEQEALMMADYFVIGIVKQFPQI